MKLAMAGVTTGLSAVVGLPILLLILLGGGTPAAAAGGLAVALCPTDSALPTAGGLDPQAAAAAQAIVAAGERLGVGQAGVTIALDVAIARTGLHDEANRPFGGIGVFAIQPDARVNVGRK